MAKEYLKSVPNYKELEEPRHPNCTPEQIFDFIISTDKREKLNYKIALIAMTGVLGLSVAGNILQAMTHKTETIFIPVEENSVKMPIGIKASTQATYQPTEKMYKHFLAEFVRKIRTRSLDAVVDSTNIANCKKFMNSVAANKLYNITQEEKKLESSQQSTVATIQVEIINIVPVNKDRSYQIRWKEVLYDQTGQQMKVRNMTGTFITELLSQAQSGANTDDILINPMGLYITDFSWDKDAGG